MKSRLVLYPKGPYVTPLLIALAGYADTLAVMANREMARGFFYQAGRLEEIGQVRQEVPAQVRYGGFKGYEEKRISRHIEEHVQWHLKRVAETARGWFELYQPDLVLLMGPPELTSVLTRWLPPEVTQRLGPTIDYFVETGGLRDIQARIEQAVTQYERQRMERWVDQLLRSVPHKAVVGVEPTLESLNEWRCAAFVFDPDERIPGVQCPGCGYLDLRSERCPRCGQTLEPIPDVVTEAVELAVQQGADLYPIRHDPALLERIQRMGAFLRF
jgi:peptide subunit release factor 1 (eRF1)